MRNFIKTYFPGIAFTVVLAIPAWILGKLFPIVGSPVIGILLGLILSGRNRSEKFQDGIRYTSKKVLQYAIILLGFQMNLFQVFQVGKQTLVLMLFTLTATFLTTAIAGKMLKLPGNTKTLIGVGTAICGGSAIAAAAPVIRADDEEVVQAISTIFLFNIIAAFLFPFLGHILGMSDHAFGLWAGTAVNDTSSVVAAGYSFSDAAGNLAVIVKLTRTLMIIPITLILAFYTSLKDKQNGTNYKFRTIFPWFVLGFIGASVCSTFLPAAQVYSVLSQLGKFAIVMAMTAIGLNTNLSKLLKNGSKPILLGLTCWFALSVTSLAVQYLLG